MGSEYSYVFTEKAESDLTEVVRYIKEDLSNPAAASSLFRKVFESISALRAFPLSGMLVENDLLSAKSVRRVVVDNYVLYLYYLPDESEHTVVVLRFVYAKRNLEDVYRELLA